MDVDAVRRFNRLVTTRVGALDEHYLTRDRPLGQSRVLWEISEAGVEVGLLRARLALDSGQLSRTLRGLETAGLVTVTAHADDARVRVARLTAAGVAEWRQLEERSQAAAHGILAALTARQQQRLVTAMREVERLLLASMVEVAETAPSDPGARFCLRAYAEEIAERFGGHFDSGGGDEALAPLLVATVQGEAIGCGGLKWADGRPPEIKRLWTSPSSRGLGLGRRLLGELEQHARRGGADAVQLDTAAELTEAIALYRSAGYVEIARYNDNPHAAHWFEKRI